MKPCQHLWTVLMNFQQWNEHRICLGCDDRLMPIKVIKREK